MAAWKGGEEEEEEEGAMPMPQSGESDPGMKVKEEDAFERKRESGRADCRPPHAAAARRRAFAALKGWRAPIATVPLPAR